MTSLEDKEAIEFLHKTAREFLPKCTKYEIRAEDRRAGFKDIVMSLEAKRVTDGAWFFFPPKTHKTYDDISLNKWTGTVESGCFKIGPFVT